MVVKKKMTKKERFSLSTYYIWDNDKKLKWEEVVELLNILSEERDYFEKKKCEYFNKWNLSHLDNINLRKENEELKIKKERQERLSEIWEQEINNRILSLKEFIENCHDDAVKKALKDYFYSTVNEYDLSAKYRELKKENEKLKKELFEAEEEYLLETYHDNPVRRDDKIELLKEEFKERFGEEYW